MTHAPQRSTLSVTDTTGVNDMNDKFTAPMIPGGREPGMLTTFGVHAVSLIPGGPSTMDAATIAAHVKEGGGAPNQRRAARKRAWKVLGQRLRHLLIAPRQRS